MPPRGRKNGSGPIRLDAVASISRTSGQNQDGDALRDHDFQDRYSVALSAKVAQYWTRFDDDSPSDSQKPEQNSLMIAFRKLREGILASHRTDAFAVHVYESSFILGCVFGAPQHATAALAHLVAILWPAQPAHGILPLLAALYTLVHLENSNAREFEARFREHSAFLAADEVTWVRSLVRLRRSGNFCAVLSHLSEDKQPGAMTDDVAGSLFGGRKDVGRRAVQQLVDVIRTDMRNKAWVILRSAYRDVVVQDSKEWLARSLALPVSETAASSSEGEAALEGWIDRRLAAGEVNRSELNGRLRWTFVKPTRT